MSISSTLLLSRNPSFYECTLEALYNKLITDNPEDMFALHKLSAIFMAREEREKAEEYLERLKDIIDSHKNEGG